MNSCRKRCLRPCVCVCVCVSQVTKLVFFFSHTHINTYFKHFSRICCFTLLFYVSIVSSFAQVILLAETRGDYALFRSLKHELYLEAFPCSHCEAWARFGGICMPTMMACQCHDASVVKVSHVGIIKAESTVIILLNYVWLCIRLEAALKRQNHSKFPSLFSRKMFLKAKLKTQ